MFPAGLQPEFISINLAQKLDMQEDKKKNTILVPTDMSDVANNALEHAIEIAKLYRNEILLLHIFEDSVLGSVWGSKNSFKDGLVGQMLGDKLGAMAKDIEEKHGVKVGALIRQGKIYKTILEVSKEIDCDSIVMGTNGAEGIQAIMGSNSSRVISQSEVPVVVVKEKKIGAGYKDIVLPIDLTLESKQKVWWAVHVGKKFNSIIHIVAEQVDDEFLLKRTKANLNQVEQVLTENNIQFTTKMLDHKNYPKEFAEDTLQYAEEIDADLIMIMTQQEKENIKEFIVGSYAQQIVNKHSRIPVMCIAPKQSGYRAEFWSGF